MTELVNPSFQRAAESYLLSGTIAGVASTEDRIVKPSETTSLAEHSGADTDGLNAFNASTSTDSYNVVIDGGEAFIFGTWVIIDTESTITLDSDTDGQEVYVGWEKETPNSVIIGKSSQFNSEDEKTLIWTFDTDLNGVYDTTDERNTESSFSLSSNTEVSLDSGDMIFNVSDSEQVRLSDTSIELKSNLTFPQATVSDAPTNSNDVARKTEVDTAEQDAVNSAESYTDTELSNHSDDTKNVHGVGSNDVASVDDIDTDISDHVSDDVHVQNQPPQDHDNTSHTESYTTTDEDVENFSTSGSSNEVPVSQGNGSLQMESIGNGATKLNVSSTNIGTSTTKLQYDDVVIDTLGYANSSNSSIDIGDSGLYYVEVQANVEDIDNDSRFVLTLLNNGSDIAVYQHGSVYSPSNVADHIGRTGGVFSLSAGDTITAEIYVSGSNNGVQDFTGRYNFMQVIKLT